MSILKFKDIKSMSKEERERKMNELKMELVKSKVSTSRTGASKTREIKKIIARILTLNKSQKEELKK